MSEMLTPHKLTLQDRNKLSLTGVSEVVSFDDSVVLLRTELGTLEVQGQDLQLKNLSLEGGLLAVEGNICALLYQEPRKGFWERLGR